MIQSTGVPNSGYYWVSQDDFNGSKAFCVKNDGGSIMNDNTECTNNSVPIDWSSSDTISGYLGLSTKEKEDLTKYLEFFNDSNQLTQKSDFPTEASDADNHFPSSIE